MNSPYPILEFDPARDTIISPRQSRDASTLPEHCVLCFFNKEINRLHQQGKAQKIRRLKSEMGSHLVFVIMIDGQQVALFNPGVGAPLAAGLFEEIIALGCRKFIACGGAGVLDNTLEVGSLLIPTAAVRDEGTSYHYLPPAREVQASHKAIAAIEHTLRRHNLSYRLVKSWTTDAFYRETFGRVAARKAEGCLTVEMEAAALFAVAQFRNVSIGQILYAGDDVSGTIHRNRNWTKLSDLRQQLIWLSAEACLRI